MPTLCVTFISVLIIVTFVCVSNMVVLLNPFFIVCSIWCMHGACVSMYIQNRYIHAWCRSRHAQWMSLCVPVSMHACTYHGRRAYNHVLVVTMTKCMHAVSACQYSHAIHTPLRYIMTCMYQHAPINCECVITVIIMICIDCLVYIMYWQGNHK